MSGENQQQTLTIPAEQQQQQQQAHPETKQEELILGKFKSQDDLVKAYQELESKLGGKKDETPPTDPPKTDEKTDEQKKAEQTQEQAKDALADAGLDINEFNDEFAKDGQLSPASYEKLAKAGFPKTMVDVYVQGLRATLDVEGQYTKAATAALEDAEIKNFDVISQWAAVTLPKTEIERFNRLMESGDRETMAWALTGLKAKYVKYTGTDPNLVTGRTNGQGDTDVFEDHKALVAAIRDPRYGKDRAYTRSVEEKVARSHARTSRSIFGS